MIGFAELKSYIPNRDGEQGLKNKLNLINLNTL